METIPSVSESIPVQKEASTSQTGKKAKDKKQAKFRAKKNKVFADELKASLIARLKISDPTNLDTVNLQRAIIPGRIPITFIGIISVLNSLWARMVSIGTRPFSVLATDANKQIFYKVCLNIFEAKVCYAQMTAEQLGPYPYSSISKFSEMQLRDLKTVSCRLPFPLVVALETIGKFTIDKQYVVPELIRAVPDIVSGAVNFSLSDIKKLVNALAAPVQISDALYVIGQRLNLLPGVDWNQQDQAVCLTPASIELWGTEISPQNRLVFKQIIASMESKTNFLLQCDIGTGDGTACQAVRFPDRYDCHEAETLYYSNAHVQPFDERLAGALLLGYEYDGEKYSRFCGHYLDALVQGSACQSECINALVWADK